MDKNQAKQETAFPEGAGPEFVQSALLLGTQALFDVLGDAVAELAGVPQQSEPSILEKLAANLKERVFSEQMGTETEIHGSKTSVSEPTGGPGGTAKS